MLGGLYNDMMISSESWKRMAPKARFRGCTVCWNADLWHISFVFPRNIALMLIGWMIRSTGCDMTSMGGEFEP